MTWLHVLLILLALLVLLTPPERGRTTTRLFRETSDIQGGTDSPCGQVHPEVSPSNQQAASR